MTVITTRTMLDCVRDLRELSMVCNYAADALLVAHDRDDAQALVQGKRQLREIADATARLIAEIEEQP